MDLLERLAYAIARGIARAWWDVQRERTLAVEEAPSSADRKRADRFADAVAGVQRAAGHGDDPRPVDTAPSGQ